MKRLSLLLVCAAACTTTQGSGPQAGSTTPKPSAGPIRLTVVGTNDLHGWVMPQVERFGERELRVGGAAALAGYLAILRAENPGGVLLLDGGDLFQGTLASNLTEGSAVIEAMNALGYDAAAVGNHEFDYGPEGPISVATKPGLDPFGALKARIEQAKFPLLSTNIYEAETGHRPSWLKGDGEVIVERHGVKIGLFGLTTPQTPTTTVPVNVSSLRFGSLAPEAMTAARHLRDEGADVVIALVHAGGKCASTSNPKDLSSCDTGSGEVFEMLRGLPDGTLDAVIAGHTHSPVAHFVGGTPVIESWGLGKFFSTVELWVDPVSRKVLTERTAIGAPVPVCETWDAATKSCDVRALKGKPEVRIEAAEFHGEKVVADAQVAARLQPALDQVTKRQEERLGLKVPKTLGRDYEGESVLGDFLADSLRTLEKADVALLNPGGLRADLKAGEVTYGAVYEVIPFDNSIATLEVSADELKRLLGAAYGSKKGVFQVSGLEVTLSRCASPDRLKNVLLEGGKPLDAKKKYRVVMPDFLARGGDGLGPVLSTIEPAQVDLGESREVNLRDALVSHWKARKEAFAHPKGGRVSFVPGSEGCGPVGAVPQPGTP